MPDTTATVGARLRAARVERGLSLAQAAQRTNVRAEHLRSLEAGDVERLPDAPYMRAFARAYAAELGIAELVEPELPRRDPRQPSVGSVSQRRYDRGFEPTHSSLVEPRGNGTRSIAVLAAFAVTMALVVGAVALVTGDEASPPDQSADKPTRATGAEGEGRRGTKAGSRRSNGSPTRVPAVVLPLPEPAVERDELTVSSDPGLALCVLSDGEPTGIAGELKAGSSRTIAGSSFEFVFPAGFDPEDLKASFNGKPVEFIDTQGPFAARVDGPGTAKVTPPPVPAC